MSEIADLGDYRRRRQAKGDDGRCASCGNYRAACSRYGTPCISRGEAFDLDQMHPDRAQEFIEVIMEVSLKVVPDGEVPRAVIPDGWRP